MSISGFGVINIILITIIVLWFARDTYFRLMAKMSATTIDETEFREGMRKAQVIDLREKDEFKAGHILGARSMPYTMFKEVMPSIRKDQPIYLYDQRKTLSIRAANKLRKSGYQNIYILKKGYEGWTGKIKKDI
ncbi:rhodanese-like domain-containing protein [Enterococcus nangangensis]|uniref:rhodanese-like domain-containing protein n=1 Tax=Enterococcus nangangensis TaxID=2559926 RepID=UPI0010F9A7BB|nr:rhodanese-like domain-containing protein [Enterococcus nangangensis]